MRFKVNENLPVEVADLLREAGHDAATVVEQGRGGAVDPDLASLIRAEGRTLVTLDVGFSNIRAFRPSDYPGLVVLRLRSQDKDAVIASVQRFLPKLKREQLEGRLWVVQEDRLRIRS